MIEERRRFRTGDEAGRQRVQEAKSASTGSTDMRCPASSFRAAGLHL